MIAIALLLLTGCAAAESPADAARDLVSRIVGESRGREFELKIQEGATPFFSIEDGEDGHVVLTGSNAGDIASALNWYLKYTARCQVSWAGDQLNLPSPLPRVGDKVHKVRPFTYGYYENVCTVSYTMAWWDWPRWEREIDWMAMNGINLPLAFTGQEYVWNSTFAEFGLSYDDLVPFFSGPAFFAWQRMGNIKGWGGPLPPTFVEARKDLQLKILGRMRSLGITPVLPAFAGHIPEALVKKYPNISYTRSPDWGGFSDQYGKVFYLNNTDPLFVKIGATFLRKQQEVYGTDHFYNADQYNEMIPPSGDHTFLKEASQSMYKYMIDVDPKAVWVMQGWLFVNDPNFWTLDRVEAYLSGVPRENLLILDLFSDVAPVYEKTKGYFGKQFIWNMLHNFGGNIGLYGRMPTINEEPTKAREAYGSGVAGVGLTPEGTLQNYPVYDLMMENAWRGGPANLTQWIIDYSRRRYGGESAAAEKAWATLLNSVYNASTSSGWGVVKSMIEVRPSMNGPHAGFMPTKPFYDTSAVVSAVKDLLSVSHLFAKQATYQYDLVDLTRQALSDRFISFHDEHTKAYKGNDAGAVSRAGQTMLLLIQDMDRLLSTNEHFLLGRWIRDARSWGAKTNVDPAYYEWNARNQVTLWGPKGEITDYASKQWGGLVKAYYYPRWKEYTDEVLSAVVSKSAFNVSTYNTKVRTFEESWQHGTDTFPTEPVGDAVAVVTELVHRWL